MGGEAGESTPFSWGPLLGPGAQVYDHAAEIYRTGHAYDQHLTMSGGSDRTTYYLSLGRLDHDGRAPRPLRLREDDRPAPW